MIRPFTLFASPFILFAYLLRFGEKKAQQRRGRTNILTNFSKYNFSSSYQKNRAKFHKICPHLNNSAAQKPASNDDPIEHLLSFTTHRSSLFSCHVMCVCARIFPWSSILFASISCVHFLHQNAFIFPDSCSPSFPHIYQINHSSTLRIRLILRLLSLLHYMPKFFQALQYLT